MNFTFYSPNRMVTTSCFEKRYWTGTAYVTETASFENLIDRTSTAQFQATYLTAASFLEIRYTFSSAVLLSFIQLKNINLKKFEVGYNAIVTHFSLSSLGGGTLSSWWDNNSDKNIIMEFATITVDSISLLINSTTSDDYTALIGEVIAGEKILQLPRNPNAAGYDPNYVNQKLEVKTIDGGSVVYNQTSKFQAKMKLEWFDHSTTMTDLKGLYDQTEPFYFTPYPTASAWYGESYECNWVGNFDFLQNKYNYRGAPYYAGTMQLKETPL